ncbi:GNAT family N-acetyltransferase [Paenibacillus sp. YAF4_2]|uniref:GNAT family N-acetyltransferase n=1 Tax=Paenibacillus sp. YAF4_2 TaxID=3233085 RepID=UPI003F9C5EF3
MPPLNPYHPTLFQPTPSSKAQRITKQWHETANLLIDELIANGSSNSFVLPPEITDIRPFLWRGFKADIKYTYYVKLPYSIESASPAIRNKIKKADAQGYYSTKTEDMSAVYQCLAGTEKRKGFSHQLSVDDLELVRGLLGDESFRCYVSYSKEGEPVSSSVTIVNHEGRALGWISATKSEHLRNGVVQQLQNCEFTDLSSIGIEEFDFYGANLSSVAASKADWGGELRTFYGVRLPGYKEIVRAGRDWLTSSQLLKR